MNNLIAEKIVKLCTERGLMISTAESCTGGLISAAITSVPGSSAVIELGICSYSNRIKNLVLGVSENTLREYSEYSQKCAEEMALGAARAAGADCAVSTSGVAGPSGGTAENPVGTVYIAACYGDKIISKRFVFENRGRNFIRQCACDAALDMLFNILTKEGENNG